MWTQECSQLFLTIKNIFIDIFIIRKQRTNEKEHFSAFRGVHNMIYAMSDIHGHYEAMKKRMEQMRPLLQKGNSRLILLGDYIDRGDKSYQCLKLAYDLEQEFGSDKVIVLKGNHEVWFEEFLFKNEDVWLDEDGDFFTTGSFLTKEQLKKMELKPDRETRIVYVKTCIKSNHKNLLSWMRMLRLYYETETQIFVHAGVDETIPAEEVEWCTLGTPDYVMTGKFPPSIGHFYKDIIAGHVAASLVAGNKRFQGIYFDGESHFYIDGSVTYRKRLLCLAYDEEAKKYYEYGLDGTYKAIKKEYSQQI